MTPCGLLNGHHGESSGVKYTLQRSGGMWIVGAARCLAALTNISAAGPEKKSFFFFDF